MRKLLGFEFRKITRQKSSLICSLIMLFMAVLVVRIEKANWVTYGKVVEGYVRPDSIAMTVSALNSTLFSLILGVFTAIYFCKDRSDGVTRNIYAKGYGRTQVFFAKLIILFAYTIILSLLSLAIVFVGGLIVFPPEGALNYQALKVLPVQIMLMLAEACFFSLVCTLCKKTGSAVASCVLSPFLISVVALLIETYIEVENFFISDYWLDNLLVNVSSQFVSARAILTGLIGGIIYAVVCTALGVFINRKIEQ